MLLLLASIYAAKPQLLPGNKLIIPKLVKNTLKLASFEIQLFFQKKYFYHFFAFVLVKYNLRHLMVFEATAYTCMPRIEYANFCHAKHSGNFFFHRDAKYGL